MKRVISAAEVRALDAASAGYGMPVSSLMENAGAYLAQVAQRLVSATGRLFYLCGPGNNGGDGLVAARHSAQHGRKVLVELVGTLEQLQGDALRNCTALQAVGIGPAPITESPGPGDVIVDCLFGTGLSRPADGAAAKAIDRINAWRAAGATVLAADVPSGLAADTGQTVGPAVRADATVTFGFLKRGLVLQPGAALAGDVHIADVGIPRACLGVLSEPGVYELEAADVLERLPAREAHGHKGTYGHVLVVGGGPGHTGAAALAAIGALRGGAGLVTVAARPEQLAEISRHAPEIMGVALPGLGPLGLSDVNALMDALDGKDALVFGPGLWRGEETGRLLGTLLEDAPCPTVLDADGLNVLVGHLDLLQKAKAELLLTPHPGEFARLVGKSPADVNLDRLGNARAFALQHQLVLALKGSRTVVARDDGALFVCPTGNPGMATGGTGDVLAGLCGALIAQGLSADDAALVGVWVHGRAGDLAAQTTGRLGLLASDVLGALGAVWVQLGR
jgi:ADP-dependent NAD(P)H-hydrate dehydratase / NAD(P)H-hydrate epimerase